ncbi:MAG: DUF1080 domain-containing protein [Deltaproteobacteria bacterium]|nr:DUF1080 domain-containing protein [Deltaproteobacteria bacterium]
MKSTMIMSIFLIFTFSFSVNLQALNYDFEKDAQMKDWTSLRGTWEVKDGALRETADAGGPLVVVMGKEDWTDYTITATIQGLIGDADWGIAFRVQDVNNHYSWQFCNGNLMLVTYVGGARTEAFNQAQGEVLNEWQDFKVEAKGNTFDLYWQGNKITTFKHDALESGQIGIFGWVNSGLVLGAGGGVAAEDFTAEGPGIPSSQAVSPNQKLTVTWGAIKTAIK